VEADVALSQLLCVGCHVSRLPDIQHSCEKFHSTPMSSLCAVHGVSDMFITHRKDMQRPSNRMVQQKRMLLTNSAWFLDSKMSDWCQVFLS
jgi:hypothetical protein